MNLSPAWLLSSLLVSTVGLGFFLYGKKQTRIPQLLAGIALMIEATFIPSPGWMVASGLLVLGALWGAVRVWS